MKKIAPFLIAGILAFYLFIGAQAKSGSIISEQTTDTPIATGYSSGGTAEPTYTPIATGYSSGGTAIPTILPISGHSSGIEIVPVDNFWDQIIMGITQFVEEQIIPIFPKHDSPTGLIQALINVIALFFRMAWVFAQGNLNLTSLWVFVLYLIATRTFLFGLYSIFWAIRVWRQIKQALPGG
jgi:hypothetical protein